MFKVLLYPEAIVDEKFQLLHPLEHNKKFETLEIKVGLAIWSVP